LNREDLEGFILKQWALAPDWTFKQSEEFLTNPDA
jgi:hypothetical protein